MNATSTMPERPRRRGTLVGPTILIGLGVVFLLNNLGWVSWGVWVPLLRLWPILLIAAGLDLLIGRRSVLGSALIVVLLLGIMAAAVWWAGVWWPSGPLTDETFTQALNGATRADITIGMGTGTLRLHGLDDSTDLAHAAIKSPLRDRPARDFSIRDGTAFFTLQSRGPAGVALPFEGQRSDQISWDVRLSQDVPTKLKVDAGLGSATLDLAQIQVTDLNVTIGIGKTTLTLPAHGRAQARVVGGIGETIISIPAGVAARITAEPGLGQVRVQGDFARQDKLYLSPNYDTAANRVDLQVSGGIGSISITQDLGR